MVTRRDFLKLGGATSAAMMVAQMRFLRAFGAPLIAGLSDPAIQPKFANYVPNALHPDFIYTPFDTKKRRYAVAVQQSVQMTGLVAPNGVTPVPTTIWGYGPPHQGVTWPGRTFEVQSGNKIRVNWLNQLREHKIVGRPLPHLLPVDESLHWAYSLPGYEHNSIARNGVPTVAHLHGGHTRNGFDGNPEYFFSPGFRVRGPHWEQIEYTYHNDQPAGNLWYHDHALGITRLNVYAGLAGFYFVRDDMDTGKADNPLGLPAYPYELAYAIQDRMFRDTGELFYPAFPGEPFYDDFITGEGAILPPDIFPGGGPTGLAEFFGDHMVVNGMIWPKEDVEPRNYRMRLLNGTDSRFMTIRFRQVPMGATDLSNAGAPLPFYVIGSDQGLASSATMTDILLSEPGGRYDVVFDFSQVTDGSGSGSRIIMENLGGDAPFGGDYGEVLDPDDFFPDRQTDRIMAFDVVKPLGTDSTAPDLFNPSNISGIYSGNSTAVDRVRKVALFEGKDEYGRLQPLLGTAEPGTDYKGRPVNHIMGPLAGQQINGSAAWHEPTTENPKKNATEIWEIYNATGDAHPVHLHLVHFQIGTGDEATYGVTRQEFTSDVIDQPIVQHNGAVGMGFRLENIVLGAEVTVGPEYAENAPKDMVTALPGQVTRIKMTFDRAGRYVWHCHILSHEDHEMMRVLHVGKGA